MGIEGHNICKRSSDDWEGSFKTRTNNNKIIMEEELDIIATNPIVLELEETVQIILEMVTQPTYELVLI